MLTRRLISHTLAVSLISVAWMQLPTQAKAFAPQKAEANAAALSKYVGQYRVEDEPEITLSFFRDGNQLAIEGPRVAHTLLQKLAQDTFTSGNGTRYVFQTDAAGKVTAVQRFADKTEIKAIRISDQP